MIIFLPFAFFLGACFGSFLNVIILRIPEEKSIWRRSSHCFSCNAPIPFYNNIPILSYCLLRGRCSRCGARFSPQYLIVELLTALLFAATFYYRFHAIVPALMDGVIPDWSLVQSALVPWLMDCTLLCCLIAMTWIDAVHFIIPLEITVTGFLVGFILCMWYPELKLVPAGLTAPASLMMKYWYTLGQIGMALVAGGGLLLLVRWLGSLYFKREAMGLGDVHLMFMLAMFMNWNLILLTIFISAFVGSIGGITAKLIMRKSHWRFEIPYGPYLALGAVISYFWGARLISWYIAFFLK